jgi:hypothetical protein
MVGAPLEIRVWRWPGGPIAMLRFVPVGSVQQGILDPARHGKQIRILLGRAQYLQPQRQATVVQDWQADARRA